MTIEKLTHFLTVARADPELRAELEAAAGPHGLPLRTLVTIAAHHGHHIDPAAVILPGPRSTGSLPPDAGSLGAVQVYEAADGTLMVGV